MIERILNSHSVYRPIMANGINGFGIIALKRPENKMGNILFTQNFAFFAKNPKFRSFCPKRRISLNVSIS